MIIAFNSRLIAEGVRHALCAFFDNKNTHNKKLCVRDRYAGIALYLNQYNLLIIRNYINNLFKYYFSFHIHVICSFANCILEFVFYDIFKFNFVFHFVFNIISLKYFL